MELDSLKVTYTAYIKASSFSLMVKTAHTLNTIVDFSWLHYRSLWKSTEQEINVDEINPHQE